MVALNETALELGLRPAARGCRVTASYPQGGTGIPAGEMNYPGAAAHMRPAATTGFRGVEWNSLFPRWAGPLSLYYTSSWQLIEVRTGGTAAADVTVQMVWSAAYINAPILQDAYSAGVIQLNSRLYFTQDTNWDTTAVVGYNATTGTWGVVQRYVYSSYGNIKILNPNFTTVPTGTVPMVNNLYQGMALDPATGLYYERARWYSPSLGTWISQDPLQYINGANTYQFVESSPIGLTDATGLMNFMQYAAPDPAKFLSIPGANFRIVVQSVGKNAVHANVTLHLPASVHNGALKCSVIKFVQFIKDGIIWKTLGELSGSIDIGQQQWKTDSGGWYPWQTVWYGSQPKDKVVFMRDTPSASGWLSVPQQRRFEARDVAVVVGGADGGKYVGAIYWGFYMDWTGRTYEKDWWGMPRHAASGPTWATFFSNPWTGGVGPIRPPPRIIGQAVTPQQ